MVDLDLPFELRLVRRALLGVWVALGLIAALALGLAIWNVSLLRAVHRAEERLGQLAAAADSAGQRQRAQALYASGVEERVTALEAVGERLERVSDPRKVVALGERVDRLVDDLEERAARTDSHWVAVARLEDRLRDSILGLKDSLESLRGATSGDLAEFRRAGAGTNDQVTALSRRIESVDERSRRGAWRRAAGGVLGVVTAGILLPHVLDHGGR